MGRLIVRVLKTDLGWELNISQENGQVFKTWPVRKLIHAIDLANTLQLHVDNITELPITQYALQSEGTKGRYAA